MKTDRASRCRWLVLPALLLGTAALLAQEARKPLAVDRLPAQVIAEPGRLTLFADYEHALVDRVPVYLVNRGAYETSFFTEDGWLPCKRETKVGQDWRRCDGHLYSFCGNSFSDLTLPPGTFVTWSQHLDSGEGELQPLRFRLYQEGRHMLISNEGKGRVSPAEVQGCRYDTMAMAFGPFEDVAAVATGKIPQRNRKPGTIPTFPEVASLDSAISGLGRFKYDERLFPTIKEVVAHLPKDRLSPYTGDPDGFVRCLEALSGPDGELAGGRECLKYILSHVRDRSQPWQNTALSWLLRKYPSERGLLRTLVEEVVADPTHQALRAAIGGCATVFDKQDANARLRKLMGDERVPLLMRREAHNAYEKVNANPFVKIEVRQAPNNDTAPAPIPLLPLMKVKITNISPQEIALPATLEDLLEVRLDYQDGSATASSPPTARGTIAPQKLKPGETVEMNEVRWWTLLTRAEWKPGQQPTVTVLARTPNLWDIPAHDDWGLHLETDAMLQALEK